MIATRDPFQCPACRSPLLPGTGLCLSCGRAYASSDGILDFVGGRFDTQLDASTYDSSHGINDSRAEDYRQWLVRTTGDRWPDSLGSVVEIGCGTGVLSRSILRHRDVTDIVLTDVSVAMLQECRRHLSRLDLLSTASVQFATYSTNEACFRDGAFDTCFGASVLHHITDVRAFLADMWRFLRPGGRAFFMEPGMRYHRIIGMVVAKIMASLLARDAEFGIEFQLLFNWISELRKSVMLQGDLTLLAALEDKHMFTSEGFEAMALEVGFASGETIPSNTDRDGRAAITSVLGMLGVKGPLADEVIRQWSSHAHQYLSLLNVRDLSLGYLFWLTKPAQPATQRLPPARPPTLRRADAAEFAGGETPLRCALALTPEIGTDGLRVKLSGWCVTLPEAKSVRITIGGVMREAPIWLPRSDVHRLINPGLHYPAWNSLCCGFDTELSFGQAGIVGNALDFTADLILHDGRFLPVVPHGTARIGESFGAGR